MTGTTLSRPPAFADLQWVAKVGGGTCAETTPDFWTYWNDAKGPLRDIGISVKPAARGWQVNFDHHRADQEAVAAGMARVREILHERSMSLSDQQRLDEERERERRAAMEAQNEIWAAEREERRLNAVRKAQESAEACLKRWGEFTAKKDRLRELASMPLTDVFYGEIGEINKIVVETTRKAAKRLAAAKLADGSGVDWSDDNIEAAVEHLTSVDSDHASDASDRGWSRADSSTGHWCAAMMAEDRPLAIKVARSLVGKYSRQLIESGAIKEIEKAA